MKETTFTENSLESSPGRKLLQGVDLPVFFLSGGLLVLFAAFALFDIKMVSSWVNASFSLSTKYFGA